MFCNQCGEPMDGTSRKQFCSDRCRAAANRAIQKAERTNGATSERSQPQPAQPEPAERSAVLITLAQPAQFEQEENEVRANQFETLRDEVNALRAEVAALRAQLAQALAPAAQPERRERRPLHAEQGVRPMAGAGSLSGILNRAAPPTAPAPHQQPYTPGTPPKEDQRRAPGVLPAKFFGGDRS